MAPQKPTPRFNPRAGDRRGQRPLAPRPSSSLWYGLAFLLLLGLAQMYYLTPTGRSIRYSEFKTLLKTGQVAEVTIGEQVIRGTLNQGDDKRQFTTTRVDDPKLTEELDAKGVKYNVFFFNGTATTEICTLSLHDALPISVGAPPPPP